jgi:tetratricopeptide (TPR) repeat protein
MKRNIILRTVDRVLEIKASDTQLIALFTATVIARNLLESLSSGLLFPQPAFVFHFPIAYIFPMLGLTGLLHILSGYPLRKLLRLMIFAWTLTLLPPLLDFFMRTSSAIGYFPLSRNNAGFFLLNFFNPGAELPGTTSGIRIEAAIGCLLAGIFAWAVANDKRILRGVFTTLLFAPVFLVFFTWPSLVYLLTVNHFPYSATVQEYFQWHAVTSPHLTGSLHYTVFLVDLLPVTFILAWFFRKLNGENWKKFISSLKHSLQEIAVPLAGSLSVFIASNGVITFADSVSISGALIAALMILFSRHSEGVARSVMWIIALSASFAVGWSTAAFALLALSLVLLPGPRWISRAVTAPALFILAASPAGLSWSICILPALMLSVLTFLFRMPFARIMAALLVLISAALLTPEGSTAVLQHYSWLNDAINRNGLLDFSLPVATAAASAGGDMLNLAKAELNDGDLIRAGWCYEIAVIDGNESPDSYRIGLNLAFSQGMTDEFENIMGQVLTDPELLDQLDVAGIILARATKETDTLFIQRALEVSGPSPQLFQAFSAACSMNGDYERAASWARAAVSHPDAQADHYSWAIHITARENGDYESLYREGISRFPGSIEIMSSRLLAPLTTGDPPDREDLLDRCLELNPLNPSVLRTAAVWYLNANRLNEAMEYSQRAIAASGEPDASLLRIACSAATEAGDSRRAEAHALYGSRLYPDDDYFTQILSGSQEGFSPASSDSITAE